MQWQKKNCLKNALSVIWKSKAFILLAVPLIGCPFRPLDTMKSVGAAGFLIGLPDLHLVANAISLDVELKAPTGRPSPLQKFMVSQMNNNAGSIGVILYPNGFEDFKNLLEGVIQCNTHIPVLNALKNAHSSTKCAIFSG